MYLIRLFLYVTSLLLIICGLSLHNEVINMIGAGLYISADILHTVQAYTASKQYRSGKWDSSQSLPEKIIPWVRTPILLGGMLTLFAGSISGPVIYFATVILWAIDGIIINMIADIPMRMTYGGWKPDRRRRRKRR